MQMLGVREVKNPRKSKYCFEVTMSQATVHAYLYFMDCVREHDRTIELEVHNSNGHSKTLVRTDNRNTYESLREHIYNYGL